jgi:hypothetical protein
MPPRGYRKHPPEPGASPNVSPNDTLLVGPRPPPHRPPMTFDQAIRAAALEQQLDATAPASYLPYDNTARLAEIAAVAALVAAAKRLAARSPDIAKPEFRGPYTKDRDAMIAALAEYQALASPCAGIRRVE